MLQEKLGLFLTVPKQQVCCFLAFAVSLSAPLQINSQRQKLSWQKNFSLKQVCFIFQSGVKIGITLFGPLAVKRRFFFLSFQDNSAWWSST